MDGFLNGSGERFQNNGVSVTRFTGFILAEAANSCKKVCGLENIRIRVDVALKSIVFTTSFAQGFSKQERNLIFARWTGVICSIFWGENYDSLLKVFGSLIYRQNLAILTAQ